MCHVCNGRAQLYARLVGEPVLSSTHCDTMEDEESEGRAMPRKQGEKSETELKGKREKYARLPVTYCVQRAYISIHLCARGIPCIYVYLV